MNFANQTPRPIDFVQGVHPTAQWFRSTAFFLLPDLEQDDFQPGTERICNFIRRHDDWYRSQFDLEAGENLHMMYHREVSISDRVPLALADRLIEIGLVAKSRGVGFSISVDLDDGNDPDIERIFEVIDVGVLSGLGILVPVPEVVDNWTETAREAWVARVERIFARQVLIGLVGSLASMRQLGLFSLESINRANLTIYPHDDDWAERDRGIGFATSSGCFARFRVYVDHEGVIYPCVALMSAGIGAMGTLDDPVEQTVFGGAPSDLDLGRLAREGPLSDQRPAERRAENLPRICERHLAYLGTGSESGFKP